MKNAKKEFLAEIEGKKLVCALVGKEIDYSWKYDWKILKNDYSPEDLETFLTSIDFEYDAGYGGQELFGIILFEDSFSDRGEYDGSEWWENHKMPTIEEVINPKNKSN